MITANTRSFKATDKMRVHLKKVSLTINNHTFDSTVSIRIFEFLALVVHEADMLNMSKSRAFIALLAFLPDPAETQLRTS